MLTSKNIAKAINSYVIPVLQYTFVVMCDGRGSTDVKDECIQIIHILRQHFHTKEIALHNVLCLTDHKHTPHNLNILNNEPLGYPGSYNEDLDSWAGIEHPVRFHYELQQSYVDKEASMVGS